MSKAAANDFLALQAPEKALFLARSSHQLTVALRGALAGTDLNQEKLCALNELIHSMTGKLRDLLLNTPAQYPDDVFIEILSDKARGKCEHELDEALRFAASKSSAVSRDRRA